MNPLSNAALPVQASPAQDGANERPLNDACPTDYSRYAVDFQSALNDSHQLPALPAVNYGSLLDLPGTPVSTQAVPQQAFQAKTSRYYHNRRLEPVAQHRLVTNSSQQHSDEDKESQTQPQDVHFSSIPTTPRESAPEKIALGQFSESQFPFRQNKYYHERQPPQQQELDTKTRRRKYHQSNQQAQVYASHSYYYSQRKQSHKERRDRLAHRRGTGSVEVDHLNSQYSPREPQGSIPTSTIDEYPNFQRQSNSHHARHMQGIDTELGQNYYHQGRKLGNQMDKVESGLPTQSGTVEMQRQYYSDRPGNLG
jgi:hypothetical protein